MVRYEQLKDYMITLANRHPNIRFVKFDTDVDAINDPNFSTPAFIISPTQSTLNEKGFLNYGFQLLYLDKLREEEDNYATILDDGLAYMVGYIEVLDLDYKVNKGINIDPILTGYEGGMGIGQQAQITIEGQFNIDKFKSYFYE